MQVQRVQRHLLRMIHSDYPDLMYPAALGCLADLEEVIKLNNLLTEQIPCQSLIHLMLHPAWHLEDVICH